MSNILSHLMSLCSKLGFWCLCYLRLLRKMVSNTYLLIWVTWRVLILREHLSLPPVRCVYCILLFVVWCPTHIVLCWIFVLFVFGLCTLCCQFIWIVHLWLILRYSLTFINKKNNLHEWMNVLLNKWMKYWINE